MKNRVFKMLLAFMTAFSLTGMAIPVVYGEDETQASEQTAAPSSDPSETDLSSIGISLDNASLSLLAGESKTLNATVTSTVDSTKYQITWASSSEAVSVTGSGKSVTVKAVSAGSATVTATIQSADGKTDYSSASCTVTVNMPQAEYRAHMQNVGWMSDVTSGAVAGQPGAGRHLEALEAKINGTDSKTLALSYSMHVQNKGWQPYTSQTAGTTGRNLHTEALKMKLEGTDKDLYDVYYALYVTELGWLNWAKNDEVAGTTGYNLSAEAVAIKIVTKGSPAPASLGRAQAAYQANVNYCAHVQNIGWQKYTDNGKVAGTTGRKLRVEALKAKIINDDDLKISYKAHVQNIGWRDYVTDNKMAGTTGRKLQVEAIRMKMTGADSDLYDLYYAVHVSNVGWLNWAKNDEIAGSVGYGLPVEAIRIVVLPKGASAPSISTAAKKSQLTATISYSAHVQNIGWQQYATNGNTAGTTGRALRVEALRAALANTTYSGNVQYRTHIQNIGWENGWTTGSAVSGTTGRSLRLEAIQFRLMGNISKYFDIYYRTHVQNIGWTGWAKNGASCGSQGYAYRMEAIQVKVLAKGAKAPGSTRNAFSVKTATKHTAVAKPAVKRTGDAIDNRAQGFSSATKNLILVNRSNHTVSVYEGSKGNWKRIKRFSCGDGKKSTPTIEGTFTSTVGDKVSHFGESKGYTCWYATRIKGNYLFHSVICKKGTKTPKKGTQLGRGVSHGCVRLSLENAKWIYDHIGHKTTVNIYH